MTTLTNSNGSIDIDDIDDCVEIFVNKREFDEKFNDPKEKTKFQRCMYWDFLTNAENIHKNFNNTIDVGYANTENDFKFDEAELKVDLRNIIDQTVKKIKNLQTELPQRTLLQLRNELFGCRMTVKIIVDIFNRNTPELLFRFKELGIDYQLFIANYIINMYIQDNIPFFTYTSILEIFPIMNIDGIEDELHDRHTRALPGAANPDEVIEKYNEAVIYHSTGYSNNPRIPVEYRGAGLGVLVRPEERTLAQNESQNTKNIINSIKPKNNRFVNNIELINNNNTNILNDVLYSNSELKAKYDHLLVYLKDAVNRIDVCGDEVHAIILSRSVNTYLRLIKDNFCLQAASEGFDSVSGILSIDTVRFFNANGRNVGMTVTYLNNFDKIAEYNQALVEARAEQALHDVAGDAEYTNAANIDKRPLFAILIVSYYKLLSNIKEQQKQSFENELSVLDIILSNITDKFRVDSDFSKELAVIENVKNNFIILINGIDIPLTPDNKLTIGTFIHNLEWVQNLAIEYAKQKKIEIENKINKEKLNTILSFFGLSDTNYNTYYDNEGKPNPGNINEINTIINNQINNRFKNTLKYLNFVNYLLGKDYKCCSERLIQFSNPPTRVNNLVLDHPRIVVDLMAHPNSFNFVKKYFTDYSLSDTVMIVEPTTIIPPNTFHGIPIPITPENEIDTLRKTFMNGVNNVCDIFNKFNDKPKDPQFRDLKRLFFNKHIIDTLFHLNILKDCGVDFLTLDTKNSSYDFRNAIKNFMASIELHIQNEICVVNKKHKTSEFDKLLSRMPGNVSNNGTSTSQNRFIGANHDKRGIPRTIKDLLNNKEVKLDDNCDEQCQEFLKKIFDGDHKNITFQITNDTNPRIPILLLSLFKFQVMTDIKENQPFPRMERYEEWKQRENVDKKKKRLLEKERKLREILIQSIEFLNKNTDLFKDAYNPSKQESSNNSNASNSSNQDVKGRRIQTLNIASYLSRLKYMKMQNPNKGVLVGVGFRSMLGGGQKFYNDNNILKGGAVINGFNGGVINSLEHQSDEMMTNITEVIGKLRDRNIKITTEEMEAIDIAGDQHKKLSASLVNAYKLYNAFLKGIDGHNSNNINVRAKEDADDLPSDKMVAFNNIKTHDDGMKYLQQSLGDLETVIDKNVEKITTVNSQLNLHLVKLLSLLQGRLIM
jgi:hypothetical protein